MVSVEKIDFTLNAWGGGTAVSRGTLQGEVLEVRVPNSGTAWMGTGSTADVTLTRLEDGGTLLALTNGAAPFTYNPRPAVHTNAAGTTAYSVGGQSVFDTGAGMPVADHIQVVIAQAQFDKSGTIYVHYREAR